LPVGYQPASWAKELIQEWEKSVELAAIDAYPTQSVLVDGPSGVGKTTASRWIAKQLSLPVYSLSLSRTIESYMGATGANLDRCVDFGIATPCVLVMDELDSVSATRSARNNEVGEIWRITNTLIQALDKWHAKPQQSMLIATTNMPESIDSAVRRRFEQEVSVELPSVRELSTLAGVALPADTRISHARMRRFILQAKRDSVLRGHDYTTALLARLSA
jgi:AAA+ superfamily predicted ATPase